MSKFEQGDRVTVSKELRFNGCFPAYDKGQVGIVVKVNGETGFTVKFPGHKQITFMAHQLEKALRYEGFIVGQTISAQDFETMSYRVEGEIVEVNRDGADGAPFAHYLVKVTKDTMLAEGERTLVAVPMETSMDWDDRVIGVEHQ